MAEYGQRKWCFSLIELMIVVSIILILATMVTMGAIYLRQHARYARTKSQLKMIETALVQYKTEQGFYPRQPTADKLKISLITSLTKENGKRILSLDLDIFSESKKDGTYMLDAYGNPFYYQCPGTMNAESFDLWSMGPDGKHGNNGSSVSAARTVDESVDDITNWKRH